MSESDVIYLASPYSHADPGLMHKRFEMALQACSVLMQRGEIVFSPIAHSHPVAQRYELPTHWDYWERVDRAMLMRCNRVYVLCLEGWRESKGIQAELGIARSWKMPILYLDPDNWELSDKPPALYPKK